MAHYYDLERAKDLVRKVAEAAAACDSAAGGGDLAAVEAALAAYGRVSGPTSCARPDATHAGAGAGSGSGGSDGDGVDDEQDEYDNDDDAVSASDRINAAPLSAVLQPSRCANSGTFEVYVAKEDFKFNAAHFVCFHGYRERLHGHSYTASCRLVGKLCADGYVVDFGDVKAHMRKACKALNERFLCPCKSDVLAVSTETPGQVTLRCQDGSFFSFPVGDCAMLPIAHSTSEELSAYIWQTIIDSFGAAALSRRGITSVEVSVCEGPRQRATFRRAISPPPQRNRRAATQRTAAVEPAPAHAVEPSGASAVEPALSPPVPPSPPGATAGTAADLADDTDADSAASVIAPVAAPMATPPPDQLCAEHRVGGSDDDDH